MAGMLGRFVAGAAGSIGSQMEDSRKMEAKTAAEMGLLEAKGKIDKQLQDAAGEAADRRLDKSERGATTRHQQTLEAGTARDAAQIQRERDRDLAAIEREKIRAAQDDKRHAATFALAKGQLDLANKRLEAELGRKDISAGDKAWLDMMSSRIRAQESMLKDATPEQAVKINETMSSLLKSFGDAVGRAGGLNYDPHPSAATGGDKKKDGDKLSATRGAASDTGPAARPASSDEGMIKSALLQANRDLMAYTERKKREDPDGYKAAIDRVNELRAKAGELPREERAPSGKPQAPRSAFATGL